MPPKSSCIGCPFHSDLHWRQMKNSADQSDWLDAVGIGHALRRNGPMRGLRALSYLHRSCVALDEVDFSSAEDQGQLNLFLNECEGMCGV